MGGGSEADAFSLLREQVFLARSGFTLQRLHSVPGRHEEAEVRTVVSCGRDPHPNLVKKIIPGIKFPEPVSGIDYFIAGEIFLLTEPA
jgi:hypothetical protein